MEVTNFPFLNCRSWCWKRSPLLALWRLRRLCYRPWDSWLFVSIYQLFLRFVGILFHLFPTCNILQLLKQKHSDKNHPSDSQEVMVILNFVVDLVSFGYKKRSVWRAPHVLFVMKIMKSWSALIKHNVASWLASPTRRRSSYFFRCCERRWGEPISYPKLFWGGRFLQAKWWEMRWWPQHLLNLTVQ